MAKKAQEGPIDLPDFELSVISLDIVGTAPLVIHKFSQKSREQMRITQETPKAQRKTKAQLPPKDFEEQYQQARHRSTEGWDGIPCNAFRAAMIDVCRAVGLVMTNTKLAFSIQPDGFDADDGTPLVRIQGDEAIKHESTVRLETGVADVRVRPMYMNWHANIRVMYDEGMITAKSIGILLDRAGVQCGVGEGRPFSKKSVGMGWGTFRIKREG